jgi:hypothetical protein
MGDLAVAARHQHLGDGFAQGRSLRDGQEMRLAFALGGGDQVGIVQPLGAFEHRAGHLDIVNGRQPPDHPHGRMSGIRQPHGQPGTGLGFDRGRKLGDDFVEQIDLNVRIAAGAGQKQVRDARQHLDAVGVGAGGERVFELVDQRWSGGHGKRVSSAQEFDPSMGGK